MTEAHKADQALADKVVALGVGRSHTGYFPALGGEQTFYWFYPNERRPKEVGMNATDFLCSPLVAMALMQKCQAVDTWWNRDRDLWTGAAWITSIEDPIRRYNESLPRAITEACVEALTESSDE